ncbi:MAG: hypothetical protein N2044_11520 [Cyclobacteriaceae bacterium]|nr:hypothetical protein [Cyclobacteriaceae bacterium]MCX7638462.1 hypothetical protein [Cyclobacteriaceae bacterium]MDW8331246.1 hypothetical protein [Cyclobacteriaceae bacterium]
MKKIILLLALSLLLASVFTLSAAPAIQAGQSEEVVDVLQTRHPNLFVFRAERKYLGAIVQVVASNGDVVTAQRLNRRKMIIDFCDVKFGAYTIRIIKDNETLEYSYVKK